MVNAEKHKKLIAESNAEIDDVKPIKSSIAVEFGKENSKYLKLNWAYSSEIIKYVADNFKKEISYLDVSNFVTFLGYAIITAETDDEKADIIKDVTDVVNNKMKLNEFMFTNLATIKSWNETASTLENKEPNEKEFTALMEKNNERNQYKAWNDERAILDAYSEKAKAETEIAINGGA